jgi:ATP-dependent protease HslVU (ClpYQ) peptidase subunit
MSTAVGLKCEDEVLIASDSILIDTETQVVSVEIHNKVFRNGKYLIGFVGELRTAQLMMARYFSPPEDIFEFPLSFIKVLKKHGSLIVADNQVKSCACDFLIAWKNRLFEFDSDFSLTEIRGYATIGTGGEYARASLCTTEEMDIDVKDRMILALKVACSIVADSAPPFFMYGTKTGEILNGFYPDS